MPSRRRWCLPAGSSADVDAEGKRSLMPIPRWPNRPPRRAPRSEARDQPGGGRGHRWCHTTRHPEVVALRIVDAVGTKQVERRLVTDELRDGLLAQTSRDLDDGLYRQLIGPIARQ